MSMVGRGEIALAVGYCGRHVDGIFLNLKWNSRNRSQRLKAAHKEANTKFLVFNVDQWRFRDRAKII